MMLAIYFKLISEDIINVTDYCLYIRRLIIMGKQSTKKSFGRKKRSSKLRGRHAKKTDNISETSFDLDMSGDTEQVCIFI